MALNLAVILLAALHVALLPTQVLASDGFLYNDNTECSIPFIAASVTSIDCQRPQQYRQQQQDGGDDEQQDGGDDDTLANACYFGDEMMVWGSFELNQKVNRYFSAIFDVCYYGSSLNAFYKPQRCKTYRRSIDMRKYAVMEGQGDEEEEEKEGYNYQSYWQDEERQQMYEERQQAQQEQDEAEETYLYAGEYSFAAYFKVPQKSFAFANESELRVKVKLVPRESYTLKYYSEASEYVSSIKDARYQTECYLSFSAIPVNIYQSAFSRYYTMAGLGILLLGTATYVSRRRIILCSCDGEEDSDDTQHGYQKHIELSDSTSTVSTL